MINEELINEFVHKSFSDGTNLIIENLFDIVKN